MDQSLLNELTELRDAFQREIQRNATEMAQIGSLLERAIQKATDISNRPQPAPSFLPPQPAINQPIYMMQPDGRIVQMMAVQQLPFQGPISTNQAQAVPNQQTQTSPNSNQPLQPTQTSGQPEQTVQQSNLTANSNSSTPLVVAENDNQQLNSSASQDIPEEPNLANQPEPELNEPSTTNSSYYESQNENVQNEASKSDTRDKTSIFEKQTTSKTNKPVFCKFFLSPPKSVNQVKSSHSEQAQEIKEEFEKEENKLPDNIIEVAQKEQKEEVIQSNIVTETTQEEQEEQSNIVTESTTNTQKEAELSDNIFETSMSFDFYENSDHDEESSFHDDVCDSASTPLQENKFVEMSEDNTSEQVVTDQNDNHEESDALQKVQQIIEEQKKQSNQVTENEPATDNSSKSKVISQKTFNNHFDSSDDDETPHFIASSSLRKRSTRTSSNSTDNLADTSISKTSKLKAQSLTTTIENVLSAENLEDDDDEVDKVDHDDDEIFLVGSFPLTTSRPVPFRLPSTARKACKNALPYSCIRRKCHIKKCSSTDMFTGKELKEHIAEIHKGRGVICFVSKCNNKFTTKEEFEKHFKDRHVAISKFYCELCLKNSKKEVHFKVHEALEVHFSAFHFEGQYRCKECHFKADFAHLVGDHFTEAHQEGETSQEGNSGELENSPKEGGSKSSTNSNKRSCSVKKRKIKRRRYC